MSQTDVRTYVTYPLLSNGVSSFPERSPYYHLQPIGVGTTLVESLTSYVSRLAAAHCVTIATLYEHTIVPSLNKSYLASPKHCGQAITLLATFKKQIKNINGVGQVAREWVDLFEKLTHCQCLMRLTFLSWSEVLTHCNLNRHYQAWCRVCYEEMRQADEIVYQPLIWTVAILQICPRHHVSLVDQCPRCSRQFPNLTRKLRLGFCPNCNHWLGGEGSSSSSAPLLINTRLEWQEFISDNICELISFTQSEPHIPSKYHIANWLRTFADRITDGKMQRLSALLGKSNLTVHEWRHGRVRPMLFELLRICYSVDIRLVDLLTGRGLEEKRLFNFRQFPRELEPIKKLRVPRLFNSSNVRPQVEKYLTVSPPVSMSRVATELGYDRDLLYKYLPDLYCRIRDRYKEFIKSERRRQRLQLEEEVKEACLELHQQGVYLTVPSIADFLGKSTYEGRRDVRAIVFETRRQLGQTRK